MIPRTYLDLVGSPNESSNHFAFDLRMDYDFCVMQDKRERWIQLAEMAAREQDLKSFRIGN
jgi:hypothetical protein